VVHCSLGQRQHFHLTLKGKESHPRCAATKREKGSAWDQRSINRVQSIAHTYIHYMENKDNIILEPYTYIPYRENIDNNILGSIYELMSTCN